MGKTVEQTFSVNVRNSVSHQIIFVGYETSK